MLNKISVIGRFVKDPEMRTTTTGKAVVTFTIACDRDTTDKSGERQADFIDCVAWQHTGEFVSKYFRKGNLIAVTGRLQSRGYTDKDGNKRTVREVLVESAYFCEPKRHDNTTPVAVSTTGFEELGDESGELPF
jgi:single-strand DNA-binding protein